MRGRDLWHAFLVTGPRKSALAGLPFTGEFLDGEAREISVPAWLASNGATRRIPMDRVGPVPGQEVGPLLDGAGRVLPPPMGMAAGRSEHRLG